MAEALIQPYLMFGGRCEEALEFYRTALGAQIDMIMRFKDSPEPPPPGMLPAGFENKVMHKQLSHRKQRHHGVGRLRRRSALQRFFSFYRGCDRSRSGSLLRRPLRRRPGANAVRQNILVTALRHAHRPFRRQLDDQCRSLTVSYQCAAI